MPTFGRVALFVISIPPFVERHDLVSSSHGRLHLGLGLQHKLGIAKGTHFRDVQAGKFIRSSDAMANKRVDHPAGNVGEGENKTDQSSHADQLSNQLSWIPVEQTSVAAIHAIPTAAVV